MKKIEIGIKRVNSSALPLPNYQTPGAAALDLRANIKEKLVMGKGERRLIATGIKLEIPSGFEGEIRPRSGLALNYGITLVNSPATIDSDYRGEIKLILINHGERPFVIKRGDRLAQLVIHKVYRAVLREKSVLRPSQRGEKGFGHSGRT